MKLQNQFSITHFIPLIGSFEIANRKFNLGFDDQYYFSFSNFKNNEIHLSSNFNRDIVYLDDKLLSDDYSIKNYKDFIRNNNIIKTNLQASIPPCGGLSKLNRHSSSLSKSNRWIYESVKWFLAQDNDCLLFENAPGLVQKEGIKVIRNIINILKFNGLENKYKLNFVYTNTLNHGLPQYRKRTFCYIYKNDKNVYLTNKINHTLSIEEFLKSHNVKNSTFFINDYAIEFLDFIKENNIISKIKEKYKDEKYVSISMLHFLRNNLEDYDFSKYKKIQRDAIKIKNKNGGNFWDSSPLFVKGKCNAIVTKGNYQRILNPLIDNEFLGIESILHLMGLENFNVIDPLNNYNHICQSVPINTARDSLLWAKEILNNNKTIDGNFDFIIQDNTKSNLENDIYYYNNDKKIKIN